LNKARNGGVALVTALLVTALAVTLVSNLFGQQQVMVRGMQGQQLRLQARLLLHESFDEARLALRDAAAAQGQVTRAHLRREIIDAQSRFNLRNLAPEASINPFQLAAFARLLATLKIDAALAAGIAEALAAGPGLAVREVGDLLAVPGVTPAVLARLRPFVTLLPEPAGVNVNTASAEVLTSVAKLTLQDAQALVARRRQAHFRDTADFALRLNERETLEGVDFHVSSHYFLVSSRVTLEGVNLDAQALLRRQGERGAILVWLRER
jgi:general secretion pathway protein K